MKPRIRADAQELRRLAQEWANEQEDMEFANHLVEGLLESLSAEELADAEADPEDFWAYRVDGLDSLMAEHNNDPNRRLVPVVSMIRSLSGEVKPVSGMPRTYRFRVATENPIPTWAGDEILRMSGADLRRYNQNPVVVDTHNVQSISAILGQASIERGVDYMDALITLDDTPEGEAALQRIKSGSLRATSIRFRPTADGVRQLRDGERDGKVRGPAVLVEKWSLLEITLCAVPADEDTVRRSFYDSIGIGSSASLYAKVNARRGCDRSLRAEPDDVSITFQFENKKTEEVIDIEAHTLDEAWDLLAEEGEDISQWREVNTEEDALGADAGASDVEAEMMEAHENGAHDANPRPGVCEACYDEMPDLSGDDPDLPDEEVRADDEGHAIYIFGNPLIEGEPEIEIEANSEEEARELLAEQIPGDEPVSEWELLGTVPLGDRSMKKPTGRITAHNRRTDQMEKNRRQRSAPPRSEAGKPAAPARKPFIRMTDSREARAIKDHDVIRSLVTNSTDVLKEHAEDCILRGLSFDAARKELLDLKAKTQAPGGTPEPTRTRGASENTQSEQMTPENVLRTITGLRS